MRRKLVVAFAVVASLLVVTAMPVSAGHADPTVVSKHTSDSDFNGATALDNTSVSGSGDAAFVGFDRFELIDGFEDGDITEWSSNANYEVTQDRSFEGDFSLNWTGGSTNSIDRDFTQDSYTGLQYHLYLSGCGQSEDSEVILRDQSGTVGPQIDVDSSCNVRAFDGSSFVDTGIDADTGVWLQFNLTNIDYGNNNFDLEVKNMSSETSLGTASNVDFRESPSELGNIVLNGESNTVHWYFDSFKDVSDPSSNGTYISSAHPATDPQQGFTNLTLSNTSAEVTWQADTNGDGTFDTDVATNTYTTSGNKTVDLSGTLADSWRVNVTFTTTDQDPVTGELHDEGVLANTTVSTVNNSSATPTGQLDSATVSLEIDVNDSDFGLAHGDSVDVEFLVDGSSVGTDTLTSNGTASISHTFSGGDHTWHVVANDSYGHSITSQTFSVTAPGNITFRDEQNASIIVDNVEVNITAYISDQIIHRSSSNGEVDLSGFPVDEPIIVRVEADGYYSRTVVIEDIFEQSDVYPLNDSVASYRVRFDLQDPTGNYPRDDTVLLVDRDINQSGSVEWRTIAGDEFGVQGVPVDLEQDHRVRIRIKNLETGTTAILGKFTPIQDETVTLSPGSPEFDFEDIERSFTWEARENESSQKIIVEYAEENSSKTADVKITIHERFNTSNVLVDNQTFTDTSSIVFEQPLTNSEANKTWSLVLYVDRGDGFVKYGPEPIGSGERDLLPSELDQVWRTSIGVFVLLIVSMAFSELNRGVGAVVTSLVGGMMWWLGLLAGVAIGPAVVFAIGVSVAYSYRLGRAG